MDNERVSNCAARIKQALNIRGMKQADLRRITKIPKSSMSQYMSGDYEPKQDRLHLIARALNVSETWLLGFDVPMERQKHLSNDERTLTEGEKMLLDLFKQVPEENQQMMLDMIRIALKKK